MVKNPAIEKKLDILITWWLIELLNNAQVDFDINENENKSWTIGTRQFNKNNKGFKKFKPADIKNVAKFLQDEFQKYREQATTEHRSVNNLTLKLFFNIEKLEKILPKRFLQNENKENKQDPDEKLKPKDRFVACYTIEENDFSYSPINDKEDEIKKRERIYISPFYYILQRNKLPTSTDDYQDFNKDVYKLFEKFEISQINPVFDLLYKTFNREEKNEGYVFFTIQEKRDLPTNLDSFYTKSIEQAIKNINKPNPLLDRYLLPQWKLDEKYNLDIRKKEKHELFYYLMNPKKCNIGRFPSNPKHKLSLMQQIALSTFFIKKSNENFNDNIISVNGPPGTGKTTLLKDALSHIMVEQIFELLDTNNNYTTINKYKSDKQFIDKVPQKRLIPAVSKYSIVVTSNNNSAVQNIVNEWPIFQKDSIDDEDLWSLIKSINYFYEKEKNLNSDIHHIGFTFECGKKSNTTKLQYAIDWLQNRNNLIQNNERVSDADFFNLYKAIEDQFWYLGDELKKIKTRLQGDWSSLTYHNLLDKLDSLNFENDDNQKNNENLWSLLAKIKADKEFCENVVKQNRERIYDLELELKGLGPFNFKRKKWCKKMLQDERLNLTSNLEILNRFVKEYKTCNDDLEYTKNYEKKLLNEITSLHQYKKYFKFHSFFFKDQTGNKDAVEMEYPFFEPELNKLRSKLLIYSLKIRHQVIKENLDDIIKSIEFFKNNYSKDIEKIKVKMDDFKLALHTSFEWLTFCFPAISTTLASFEKMFTHFSVGELNYVILDEAGQAVPCSLIPVINRASKIIVVGDPKQIPPINNIEQNVVNGIANYFKVDPKYVSFNSSVQSIVDENARFCYIEKDRLINKFYGIPLWVHRRCKSPMFDISNEISYNGNMVQGKNDAKGAAYIFDVVGTSNKKYVKAQAEMVANIYIKKLNILLAYDATERKKEKIKQFLTDTFVISPFREVADQTRNFLKKSISDYLKEQGIATNEHGNEIPIDEILEQNVGTIHTFQGKEAKRVILVFGCDETEEESARWALEEPNILNVAVSRSKDELYVIANLNLYSRLKNPYFDKMIEIIKNFNKEKKTKIIQEEQSI
ncbi:DEAD/DEAH box helicase [Ureaplasma canigenitalium]|uniref:DEAD/DEAH box helicase n=1 Tax=Ureaplasma canigenitalium TaxID=42092 RepID=UPI0004E0B392|nr:AAA domain-containing protein [Ureaplasma canigenitalium]